MTSRTQRAKIAAETVEILERGRYTHNGVTVSLSRSVDKMRAETTLYTPENLASLIASLEPPESAPTAIDVANTTTFAAARSLIAEGWPNPLCLNFASAKQPGGGFLSGAQAQEECLARASALYASLLEAPAYYEANRACRSSLYTHHLIYTPAAPVFRGDDDQLLAEPYEVSLITAPAVNAGAVRQNEPDRVADIQATMLDRIRRVLAVARHRGHEALVLGAWGCGVFRNDPAEMARWFSGVLSHDSRFAGAFRRIVFAVLDTNDDAPTFRAFQQRFAAPGQRPA